MFRWRNSHEHRMQKNWQGEYDVICYIAAFSPIGFEKKLCQIMSNENFAFSLLFLFCFNVSSILSIFAIGIYRGCRVLVIFQSAVDLAHTACSNTCA